MDHPERDNSIKTVLAVIVMAAVLAGLVALLGVGHSAESGAEGPHGPVPVFTATPTPTPEPTPEATPEPSPTPAPARYDFAAPVPESEEAPEGYFEDAVFIGDSRTHGFLLYSGVKGADGIHYTGLTIFGVRKDAIIDTPKGKQSVMQVLNQKQYGKVYLALGVNELGYQNDQKFKDTFTAVIREIKAGQPNAVIYIQNLIPLNESQVNQSYLRNEHLRDYNKLMAQVAEEEKVAYIDLYSAFVGEDGQLPKDASNDGVHMKKPYCEKWLQYLKTHTVSAKDMGLPREQEAVAPVTPTPAPSPSPAPAPSPVPADPVPEETQPPTPGETPSPAPDDDPTPAETDSAGGTEEEPT